MKNILILVGLVFVGVLAWRLSDTISHDAITLAIGFLFGVVAGIPAALIVQATQRRREPDYTAQRDYQRQAQPPVIVVAGNPQPYHQPHHDQPPAWPTGGGSYNMLGGPQDGRFSEAEAEARRKWGER